MGSTLRRRSRRWLPHAVAMVALLCALPSTASAAPSSYDRLANVSHTSLAGTGGLGLRLGTIQIVPGVSLSGVQVRLNGARVRFAADLNLRCAQGGSITGGGAGDINFTSARTWSVTLRARTGSGGCQLAREIVIGPNADVAATLRAQDGVLYILVDAKATLKQRIIPGLADIGVDAHLALGGGAYDVSVEGGVQGLRVKGAIASNGTFDLALDLDDLQLGGARIALSGRLARTTPRGALVLNVGGGLTTNVQILPGLNLRAVSASISNNAIAVAGTIRLACQGGYVDATARGEVRDVDNFSLVITGTAPSACQFGKFIRLRGDTISGRLAVVNGVLEFDADLAVERVNLGELRLTPSDAIGVWADDARARITNSCAGCPRNQLRLGLAAKGTVAVRLGFLPQTLTVTAGVRVDFGIRFDDFALTRLSLQLTSLSFGSVPRSYQPMVQRAIVQAFEAMATHPSDAGDAVLADEPLLSP